MNAIQNILSKACYVSQNDIQTKPSRTYLRCLFRDTYNMQQACGFKTVEVLPCGSLNTDAAGSNSRTLKNILILIKKAKL